MRVTCAVREYVRKAVLSKVAKRLEKAEKARDAAKKARDGRVGKARELAKAVAAHAQEAFAKRAAKMGLTFNPDSYDYTGRIERGERRVFNVRIESDDFVETASSDSFTARYRPCAAREAYRKVVDEPERIREAARHVADRLLFDLELGKVAKQELDEMLKSVEVKL